MFVTPLLGENEAPGCPIHQFRGLSKMTLSSLQAQAPRAGFSPSNCTQKTKRSRLARFAN